MGAEDGVPPLGRERIRIDQTNSQIKTKPAVASPCRSSNVINRTRIAVSRRAIRGIGSSLILCLSTLAVIVLNDSDGVRSIVTCDNVFLTVSRPTIIVDLGKHRLAGVPLFPSRSRVYRLSIRKVADRVVYSSLEGCVSVNIVAASGCREKMPLATAAAGCRRHETAKAAICRIAMQFAHGVSRWARANFIGARYLDTWRDE